MDRPLRQKRAGPRAGPSIEARSQKRGTKARVNRAEPVRNPRGTGAEPARDLRGNRNKSRGNRWSYITRERSARDHAHENAGPLDPPRPNPSLLVGLLNLLDVLLSNGVAWSEETTRRSGP